MKLDKAIRDTVEAEVELAQQLRIVGERHAVEHDLYHLGHTLARQCAGHVEQLAPFAARYGASGPSEAVSESPGIMGKLRHKGAELVGRRQAAGMLLLRDLRHLYLAAQEAEISWVILAQVAQAVRDRELLEVTTVCHEHAEVRGKWLRTRIKQSAPQVLATK
jgi:hypothetical protein